MGCIRRPALHGVVMIALVACVALAAAQNGHRGVGDRDASAMDETTGSTTNRAPAQLALSDEQRGRIYESVMRIPDAPVEDLPAGLAREIPLMHGHKFVKFDDRIVVVNPASRLVVAMIPRYKLLP
jgi:hypothetical protein